VGQGFESNSIIASQSIGKYLQDIWLIAFLLILIPNQASFSLPLLWLIVHAFILSVILFVFKKTGYQIAVSLFVALIIGLSVFIFDGPFWFYIIIVLASVWRIQERFATEQEDLTHDGSFFMLLIVFFAISIFVSRVLNNSQAIKESYALVISGVVIFVLHRLVVQWLLTREVNKIPFHYIVLFFVGIMGIASSIYLIISLFAEKSRVIFVGIFGDFLMVLLVPFGSLLNLIRGIFLSIMPPQEEKKETGQEVSQALEKIKPIQVQLTESRDIPWMAVAIGVTIVIIVLLLWLLSKKRLEMFNTEKKIEATITREAIMTTTISKSEEVAWSYSMDTNIVREAYRLFESKAKKLGLARLQDETVREWFNRQNWEASNQFFSIYDSVRYGQDQMNSSDGEWFIVQLDVLSEKYFSEKV
jgi:hypothetical protein